MICAICGGPILEVYRGNEHRFLPAWWVKADQWGASALSCRELRPVDLERVALALADETGGLRTAILWVAAGRIASHLRGLRGFALKAEGLGAWFDLALDGAGQVQRAAPTDVDIAHIGWEGVTLIRVREGRVVEVTPLAGVRGFQGVAGKVLARAYRDHTIRWDLLEAGWRAQQADMPFPLQADDVEELFAAVRESGAQVFSGLGEKAFREVYGADGDHSWPSPARGLAKYALFLEQQAGKK